MSNGPAPVSWRAIHIHAPQPTKCVAAEPRVEDGTYDDDMAAERRQQPRIAGPFEASWNGTSGRRNVRCSDFSLTGCFIEDIALPREGEQVIVTLSVPGGPAIEAAGRVAYVASPHGFAVEFVTTNASRAR